MWPCWDFCRNALRDEKRIPHPPKPREFGMTRTERALCRLTLLTCARAHLIKWEGRKKAQMQSKRMKGWEALFVGLLLSAPAWGADQNSRPVVPGTLNYVEGKVSLDGQTLGPEAIGSTVIEAGQTLSTEAGKAEILLTPGILLRVASNSAARMISPGLANTQVELERGQAIVEVAEIHPENNIRISQDALTVRLEKTGLYEFVVDGNHVGVFEGKAEVDTGSRQFTVK